MYRWSLLACPEGSTDDATGVESDSLVIACPELNFDIVGQCYASLAVSRFPDIWPIMDQGRHYCYSRDLSKDLVQCMKRACRCEIRSMAVCLFQDSSNLVPFLVQFSSNAHRTKRDHSTTAISHSTLPDQSGPAVGGEER